MEKNTYKSTVLDWATSDDGKSTLGDKKLTDEEVDYLFENLTATKMKELQNILPDIAWTALYRKFVKRAHMKVNLANNFISLLDR